MGRRRRFGGPSALTLRRVQADLTQLHWDLEQLYRHTLRRLNDGPSLNE
jgi:hypothetical protein